jgi:hypothetical protein
MTDLSPLSGEERKSDFGAIRSVDDPLADFSPADTCGYNRAGLRPTECQDADGARLASSLHFPHRRLILVLRRSQTCLLAVGDGGPYFRDCRLALSL